MRFKAYSRRAPSRRLDGSFIGRTAICALYAELALYPKPGLVSRVDSGAHDDMSIKTFVRSLFTLRSYFREIAEAGAGGADFADLQALGIAAERRMLAATGGINTHRGAIFSLGLLAAASGLLLVEGARLTPASVCAAVAENWGEQIRGSVSAAGDSHGSVASRRSQVGGARVQAAGGFPVLVELALPTLEGAFDIIGDLEAASVQTLYVLMASLDDTNLLHRGGREGLEFVQRQARAFLETGGVAAFGWHARAMRLHRDCVQRKLSPGGSADMLAAALFLRALCSRP